MDIQKQFEIFRDSEGTTITKLRKAGYAIEALDDGEIESIDDFKKIIGKEECFSKDRLKKEIKKVYKNHISLENLKKFLSAGENGFDENQMADALRMIPLNEDGSISIEDLIQFLYK